MNKYSGSTTTKCFFFFLFFSIVIFLFLFPFLVGKCFRLQGRIDIARANQKPLFT